MLYYDLDAVEVRLTHVERVVYPDVGITKGEIIAYYRVSTRGRLLVAAVYIGLAALLVVGLHSTYVFRGL